MFSVLVYPLIIKFLAISCQVVFEYIQQGKDESKSKKKNDKSWGNKNDDVFSDIISAQIDQNVW